MAFLVDEEGLVWQRERGPDPDPEQVGICRLWISENCRIRDTFNHTRNSYAFKHAVKYYTRSYVSNGAFIAAALELGYDIKMIGRGPNALFNMGKKRKEKVSDH
jgi:hypothetical protein